MKSADCSANERRAVMKPGGAISLDSSSGASSLASTSGGVSYWSSVIGGGGGGGSRCGSLEVVSKERFEQQLEGMMGSGGRGCPGCMAERAKTDPCHTVCQTSSSILSSSGHHRQHKARVKRNSPMIVCLKDSIKVVRGKTKAPLASALDNPAQPSFAMIASSSNTLMSSSESLKNRKLGSNNQAVPFPGMVNEAEGRKCKNFSAFLVAVEQAHSKDRVSIVASQNLNPEAQVVRRTKGRCLSEGGASPALLNNAVVSVGRVEEGGGTRRTCSVRASVDIIHNDLKSGAMGAGCQDGASAGENTNSAVRGMGGKGQSGASSVKSGDRGNPRVGNSSGCGVAGRDGRASERGSRGKGRRAGGRMGDRRRGGERGGRRGGGRVDRLKRGGLADQLEDDDEVAVSTDRSSLSSVTSGDCDIELRRRSWKKYNMERQMYLQHGSVIPPSIGGSNLRGSSLRSDALSSLHCGHLMDMGAGGVEHCLIGNDIKCFDSSYGGISLPEHLGLGSSEDPLSGMQGRSSPAPLGCQKCLESCYTYTHYYAQGSSLFSIEIISEGDEVEEEEEEECLSAQTPDSVFYCSSPKINQQHFQFPPPTSLSSSFSNTQYRSASFNTYSQGSTLYSQHGQDISGGFSYHRHIDTVSLDLTGSDVTFTVEHHLPDMVTQGGTPPGTGDSGFATTSGAEGVKGEGGGADKKKDLDESDELRHSQDDEDDDDDSESGNSIVVEVKSAEVEVKKIISEGAKNSMNLVNKETNKEIQPTGKQSTGVVSEKVAENTANVRPGGIGEREGVISGRTLPRQRYPAIERHIPRLARKRYSSYCEPSLRAQLYDSAPLPRPPRSPRRFAEPLCCPPGASDQSQKKLYPEFCQSFYCTMFGFIPCVPGYCFIPAYYFTFPIWSVPKTNHPTPPPPAAAPTAESPQAAAPCEGRPGRGVRISQDRVQGRWSESGWVGYESDTELRGVGEGYRCPRRHIHCPGTRPYHSRKSSQPSPPQRPWLSLNQPDVSSSIAIFTVMCYNVLSDQYATRQLYGYCPSWALNWAHRKYNILDEICQYSPDIIALQEVETEQFYEFFLPELRIDGYEGIFSPKSRAKTMTESGRKRVDGCAIFYRTNKFRLVKEHLIEFNELAKETAQGSHDMINRVMTKDNIGLAAVLQLLNPAYENGVEPDSVPEYVLLSTCHMHWDPEYSDVKLIQTMMLMAKLRSIAMETKNSMNAWTGGGDIPLILCGDLNSLPDSGVVEYLAEGSVSAKHKDFKELGYDDTLHRLSSQVNRDVYSHSFKLSRAYVDDLLPFTNYTYDFKGIIDYIFYTDSVMKPLGLLGPLDPNWFIDNHIIGCPNPQIPSDHLPLLVEFEMKFSQNDSAKSSLCSNLPSSTTRLSTIAASPTLLSPVSGITGSCLIFGDETKLFSETLTMETVNRTETELCSRNTSCTGYELKTNNDDIASTETIKHVVTDLETGSGTITGGKNCKTVLLPETVASTVSNTKSVSSVEIECSTESGDTLSNFEIDDEKFPIFKTSLTERSFPVGVKTYAEITSSSKVCTGSGDIKTGSSVYLSKK